MKALLNELIDREFPWGSLSRIRLEAEKVTDILYVMAVKPNHVNTELNIMVKPNYDVDNVLDFINNNVPLNTYYHIIVEENYELIKNSKSVT